MRSQLPIARRRRDERGGFTLIELMLASLLAAVLLVAVGAALRIELHFFDSGRRDAEAAQLGRALIDRISEDLRQVVISPEIRVPGGKGASPAGVSSAEPMFDNGVLALALLDPQRSTSEESSPPQPTVAVSTTDPGDWHLRTGLVGTRRSLRLDVRRADPKAPGGGPEETGLVEFQPVELPRTILYELVPPNPVGNGVGSLAIESDGTADSRAQLTGLVRRETPLGHSPGETAGSFGSEGGVGLDFDAAADPHSASDDPLEQRDEAGVRTNVVPEVANVWFRYSNGQLWSESWDSRAQGGLPAAVEISLWFVRPETAEPAHANVAEPDFAGAGLDGLDDAEPIEPPDYRVVISIPTAQTAGSISNDGTAESPDEVP